MKSDEMWAIQGRSKQAMHSEFEKDCGRQDSKKNLHVLPLFFCLLKVQESSMIDLGLFVT